MTITAHDMSKYQRLIQIENPGGRVSGLFHVLPPLGGDKRTTWIKPVDVTIYLDDECRGGGLVYHSGTIHASVTDGIPEFRAYTNENHKALLDQVREEFNEVLLTLAAFEWVPFDPREGTR